MALVALELHVSLDDYDLHSIFAFRDVPGGGEGGDTGGDGGRTAGSFKLDMLSKDSASSK